jgi:D-methionine transport system ATP-binding protein
MMITTTTPAALALDLQWEVGGHWYALQATCGPGLTALAGPAAPALLRLLAGGDVARRGTALLDGRPLAHGKAVARRGPRVRPIAAVLADDTLPLWRTPLGLATSAVRVHGVPLLGARARALQSLRWVGAAHLARWPIISRNAADRRRAALAVALAVVPGLLLLERPCAPLQIAAHGPLYATLHEIAEAWAMTVLLIPDAGHAAALPVLTPLPAG